LYSRPSLLAPRLTRVLIILLFLTCNYLLLRFFRGLAHGIGVVNLFFNVYKRRLQKRRQYQKRPIGRLITNYLITSQSSDSRSSWLGNHGKIMLSLLIAIHFVSPFLARIIQLFCSLQFLRLTRLPFLIALRAWLKFMIIKHSLVVRSEERRVGKEWRCRWRRYS